MDSRSVGGHGPRVMQDELDASMADDPSDDVRCSGDSVMLQRHVHESAAPEKRANCQGSSPTRGRAGEVHNESGLEEPQSLEYFDPPSASLCLEKTQSPSTVNADAVAGVTSETVVQTALSSVLPLRRSMDTGAQDGITSKKHTSVTASCVPAHDHGLPTLIHLDLSHVAEQAAFEVGMERYLGMAEAVHGTSNHNMVLHHALKLAVEDRIRCRM